MDIDSQRFYPHLLQVLKHISNATFITFDLEMSGISIRQRHGVGARTAKPTMQQQYEETKEAAEKYQILQLGITCVEKDEELGMYIARPFNFNVSPLFIEEDRLGINRDVTLSSSAVHFLMKNNFDMGAVFTDGVSYLSREEAVTARKIYAEKEDRAANMADISIAPSDQEALKFLRKARETVASWTGAKKKEMDFVNIGCPGGLNGYQRRLVHQLIRNEFPGYRVFSVNYGQFMQVEKIDPIKEANIAKSKLKGFELGLARQIGVRYIIEALAGGQYLDEIEPKWFCITETGASKLIDVEATKKEISELQEALGKKNQVIVGHNLFTDLIFIYKTFIADLPDSIEEFQERIHQLFPQIIDTKYLSTHEGGSMRANSSLKDMCDMMADQPWPLVTLAEEHNGYSAKGKEHEAGYDSWMTAQVLIKLSAKLKAAQLRTDYDDDATAYNSDGATIYHSADDGIDSDDGADEILLNPPDTDLLFPPLPLQPLSNGNKVIPKRTSSKKKSPKRTRQASRARSRFSNSNIFDQLAIEGAANDSDSSSDGGVPLPASFSSQGINLMDSGIEDLPNQAPISPVPSKLVHGQLSFSAYPKHMKDAGWEWHARQLNLVPSPDKSNKNDIQKWMPSFDRAFWSAYKNKLRVYGTDTEVCRLGD